MSEFHRQKYAEYLALKGLRLTREREILVQAIFSSGIPFDAETLIERFAQGGGDPRVSRSTIYRALFQLEDAGLIRKVVTGSDRDVYITIAPGFHA